MKIISGALILVTVYLNIKHGYSGLSNNMSPQEVKMMSDLGIQKPLLLAISICSILSALLIIFPQTFFMGCVISAMIILLMMALALKNVQFKFALIEIPFLLIPLLLIWLGHPLKNG
jgi:hypothetical protein